MRLPWLIVLDLNLPKLQGMDVLKELRTENKNIPVLILSAKNEVESKMERLDGGANDYLAKPFYFAELEARVRALLRRDFKTNDTVVEIGNVKIDTAAKKLFISDKETELSKKEYCILEYLCLHRGETISATKIIENVWESDSEGSILLRYTCVISKKNFPKNS